MCLCFKLIGGMYPSGLSVTTLQYDDGTKEILFSKGLKWSNRSAPYKMTGQPNIQANQSINKFIIQNKIIDRWTGLDETNQSTKSMNQITPY